MKQFVCTEANWVFLVYYWHFPQKNTDISIRHDKQAYLLIRKSLVCCRETRGTPLSPLFVKA